MATLRDPSMFFSTLNEKLEPPLKTHLKNVYSCLSVSLISAAVGSYIHLFTNLLQGNLWISLLGLGFMLLLFFTPDNGKNALLRMGYLQGFTFTSGLCLGPLMEIAIRIDPTIVSTAFLGTALIFVCFTFAALLSDQRQWLYLQGMLFSGISILTLLAFMNIFMRSQLLFQAHVYIGLAISCGFIIYDTQLIIEKSRRGDRDFIWHSIYLFIDFIEIFRYLMVILAQKEDKKKNK